MNPLITALSSSTTLFVISGLILLLGFLAIAILNGLTNVSKAQSFIGWGVVAFIGLLGISIRIFNQLIPLFERQIWGGVGIGLTFVGLVMLFFSLRAFRKQKQQRYRPSMS